MARAVLASDYTAGDRVRVDVVDDKLSWAVEHLIVPSTPTTGRAAGSSVVVAPHPTLPRCDRGGNVPSPCGAGGGHRGGESRHP